jgi:hypothetical protein
MFFLGYAFPPFWLLLVSCLWLWFCLVMEPDKAGCFIITWITIIFLYSHGYLTFLTGCGV